MLHHANIKRTNMIPRSWYRKIIELRQMLWVSVPIGIIAGLGVSLLEYICNNVLWNHITMLPIEVRLIFPPLGLLISGWVLHRLGVAMIGMLNEVVIHYHEPPHELSLKEDAMKALACIGTVGFGASLGLGGPSQWLGTRIALYVRRFLAKHHIVRGLSKSQIVLIGAAAGVSAIFRAPLAGTLLALETPFSKDIEGPALLPASIAAVVGSLTHGLLMDNKPLLPFPESAPHSIASVLAALLIGLAAGFISRRFQRALTFIRTMSARRAWYVRSLVGGVLTSATGLIAYHYFGDTYTLQAGLPLSHLAFAGQFVGVAALVLLILKICAVWATAGSTGVAGLLVVTLTVGSLIGASVQPLVPFIDPATAAAIGVCAYLAANYNAPLTGIVLAAEWGGTGLLPVAWFSVMIASWIGEGLANTPSKRRRRPHHTHLHHVPQIQNPNEENKT